MNINCEKFTLSEDFVSDFFFCGGASPVDRTEPNKLETATVCDEVLESFTANDEDLIEDLVDAAILSDDVNEIKINFDPSGYFTNDQESYDYYNVHNSGAVDQSYPAPQALPALDNAYSPRQSDKFDSSPCSTPCDISPTRSPNKLSDWSAVLTPAPPMVHGSTSPRTTTLFENEPAMPMMSDPMQSRFDCMTVQQLRDEELTMEELIDYQLVARFAYDKIGCHYLQHKLQRVNEETSYNLITAILDSFVRQRVDLVRMSEDVYGNYFVQIIAERASSVHHQILLNYFVYSSVLRLSRSQGGCRVLQNLIHALTDEGQMCELADSMRAQLEHSQQSRYETIDALLVNCNAAHVMQALIEVGTPFDNIAFIAEELNRNLAYYAEDTYACRVIQALIKQHGNKLDFDQLFLNGNHFKLSRTTYGNYVIQCIVEKGKWYSQKPAFKAFRNQLIDEVFVDDKILSLSRNKHGSHMIETCLKSANKKQISAFIEAVCARKAFVLKEMLKHRFGNFVPKTLMAQCNKEQQRTVVEAVHSCIGNLNKRINIGQNRFFNLNREFFHQCQAVKFNMDGRHYCSHQ